jgi:hypothetical protein
MEVPFTPEQEARIAQIATNAGTDAEHLVKDAALRLLGEVPAFAPSPKAVWLPKCERYAPASNLIQKVGQPAITSTMAADKWLWLSMLPLPLHGPCPMKAAPMPTPFSRR